MVIDLCHCHNRVIYFYCGFWLPTAYAASIFFKQSLYCNLSEIILGL